MPPNPALQADGTFAYAQVLQPNASIVIRHSG